MRSIPDKIHNARLKKPHPIGKRKEKKNIHRPHACTPSSPHSLEIALRHKRLLALALPARRSTLVYHHRPQDAAGLPDDTCDPVLRMRHLRPALRVKGVQRVVQARVQRLLLTFPLLLACIIECLLLVIVLWSRSRNPFSPAPASPCIKAQPAHSKLEPGHGPPANTPLPLPLPSHPRR